MTTSIKKERQVGPVTTPASNSLISSQASSNIVTGSTQQIPFPSFAHICTYHGFIGIDGLVEILSPKEFRQQGLDLGNPSGTSHEDDLIDLVLAQSTVLEDLRDRRQCLFEQVEVEFLEFGSR